MEGIDAEMEHRPAIVPWPQKVENISIRLCIQIYAHTWDEEVFL